MGSEARHKQCDRAPVSKTPRLIQAVPARRDVEADSISTIRARQDEGVDSTNSTAPVMKRTLRAKIGNLSSMVRE